jgi:XTP/dITP diphosphohydrolase
MRIYFATSSAFKAKELEDFLTTVPLATRGGADIVVYSSDLPEVLESDIDTIVTQKAIDAYQRLALPCVVEHSGLVMDALPGLPGGLGQIIWKAIGDRMCGFLRDADSRAATARSVIGYCDGRHVTLFGGETRGSVAERARGEYAFNWDPIFIPERATRTYGEMGLQEKRKTSPVHKAWLKFFTALSTGDHHPMGVSYGG